MTRLQRFLVAVSRTLCPQGERGSATVFVLGMSVTMLVCAGLVLDGGTALNARMAVADNVEQAARSGAQQIDVEHLRTTGVVRLDETKAREQAQSYISSFGYRDVVVVVAGDRITVQAEDVVEARMLKLIGVNEFDIGASATSEAVTR